MLTNTRLGVRLGIGFGVVLVFLITVGFFAITTMNTLTELNSKMYQHPFTVQRATLLINSDVISIHRAMKDVVLSRTEAGMRAATTMVTALETEALERLKTVEARFLGERKMYEKARMLLEQWRPIRAEVIDLVRRGQYQQAAAITKGKGNDHVLSIVAAINALDAFAAQKASEFYQQSRRVNHRAYALMYSLIGFAIVACAILTFVIARSVSGPARQIARASKAIADGDLDHRFEYSSRDEIGQMADSLRNMVTGLTSINASLKKEIEGQTQARRELRASEERYRQVLEDQTEIICRFKADGTLIYVNEAFCKLFDKTPEELINQAWQPVAHTDDMPLIEEKLALLTQDSPIQTTENRVITGNGETRWMQFANRAIYDDRGELTEIQSVGRDIHERKLAEEKLQTYQEHLETMVLQRTELLDEVGRIAWTGGWEMDLETSQAQWTLETYRIVEIEPGEPIPGPDEHISFYLPEYRPMITEAMRALVKDDQPLEFEAEVQTAKGNIKWCRAIGRTIRENGRVVRLVGTFQDISEQREQERERRVIQDRLRQSQKMESIGTLAGGIAHDFNNILTAISGYGELALEDIDDQSPIRENLELIMISATRATNLVRQLLAFSRKQILEMKTFALNDVIKRNHSMISHIIGENIAIDLFLDVDTGLVRADFNQLEQVLLNLAVNARDAMPDGGRLTFETSRIYLDEEYTATHAEVEPGDYAMMAVSDTGPGIDPETLEHMFDPFFTTKEVDKGTGMGLATVHGIVKQHKGHISIYSEIGIGTVFKIYLPCSKEGEEDDGVELKLKKERKGGSETVLLVEDEQAVRHFVGQALRKLGYRVLSAENGSEALELMNEHSPDIDLLLTDVIMPGLSGKDLYIRLAAGRPGLRVAYMSGYTHNVIAHQGVLDPGVSFLQKPVSLDDLAAKVRQTLDSPQP